jgi:hypothetical protein
MLILSYFHENPLLFPAKNSLQNVRYWDYVECCQRQKKTSGHESIINLTENVLCEIGISRLPKVYFCDNCVHLKCYAFSRKNKSIFGSTQRNQIVYFRSGVNV